MKRWLAQAGVLALAGCVHADRPSAGTTVAAGNPPVQVTFEPPTYLALPPGAFPHRERRKTLTFETTCTGKCHQFWLQVDSEGLSLFEDRDVKHRTQARDFKFTPEQFAAFEAALAPYQPKGERHAFEETPLCGWEATRPPDLLVTWTLDDDPSDMLVIEHGCTVVQYAAMQAALIHALDLLPEARALIGPLP